MRRAFFPFGPVILYLILLTTSASAQSLVGYRNDLRAALTGLATGDSRDVAKAVDRLRQDDSVTLPDGTTMNPDNTAVVDALRSSPPDVATARAMLMVRLAALDAAPGSSATSASDARDALNKILARPEFQPASPPDPLTRFIDNVERAIGRFILALLELIFGGGAIGDPRTLLWGAVGVLACLGIVGVGIRALHKYVGPSVTAESSPASTVALTSESVRREAERLARAGAFRAAVHALNLAALLYWDEQGRIRFDRTLTNREMLLRARAKDDESLVERLTPMVDRFDRVWYGGWPCTAEEYDSFRKMAERAWELS